MNKNLLIDNMYENYSDFISVATGAFGIANIKEILGIIVLILSILNILINLALRIYHKVKERKYDQIPSDTYIQKWMKCLQQKALPFQQSLEL